MSTNQKYPARRPRTHGAEAKRHSGQSNNPGDWKRNYERHCELARSLQIGDAVDREMHWQHAEHYCRLMNGSATQ